MSKKILLSIVALILSSMACGMFVGGPEYPEGQIPVSTEIAGSFEEQLRQALESAQTTGELSFSMTESQLTSLLAQRIAADPNSLLNEPQVYLRDSEIQAYGNIQQGPFTVNVRIALSVAVDDNAQPSITVKSMDLGPLPAPQGLNDSISALFNEAFTGALGPAATGFRLESITIENGLMTFSGRTR